MTLIVSKSSPVVVVGPSSSPGTPAAIINLSSFDKCLPLIPISVLLIFDQPIDAPVETIKKALSRALEHYQPMAGRLATGPDGELHIACTGEGVPFVAASASCSIDEVATASTGPPPLLLLKDLSVRYPGEYYCRLSEALLMIQVTEFSCGGFVVGATWNHLAGDAAGIGQFLQAVGELARGMPTPSVVPVRSDDGSLRYCMPPLPPTAVEVDAAGAESAAAAMEMEMASIDFTVSSSLIGRIKAECGGRCTVFDAVAAVLWRCRTRAIMSMSDDDMEDEAPAQLSFACNVRKLVGARDGYYGNCVTVQSVRATSGTVAGCDIKDLVRLIRLAKEKIPDLFEIKNGTDDQEQPPEPPKFYSMFGLTSWRNIGLETTDLGRGRPARVMTQPEKTHGLVCVLCPPCKGEDGVNVQSRCVRPEHADAFLGELAALDKAL